MKMTWDVISTMLRVAEMKTEKCWGENFKHQLSTKNVFHQWAIPSFVESILQVHTLISFYYSSYALAWVFWVKLGFAVSMILLFSFVFMFSFIWICSWNSWETTNKWEGKYWKRSIFHFSTRSPWTDERIDGQSL